ncbi:hypothetical protein HDU98_002627 [Podochytrium sp. JEL0797]|nr:hypothetical protein HDU98_002627 [Podochytrium sp. JEL0797]
MKFAPVSLVVGLLSQTALSQTCSLATDPGSLFVFNPPALTYDSSIGGAIFTIKLACQPEGDVRAAFKMAGLQMHNPIVAFTADNWSIPQSVTITAASGALVSAGSSVEVDIDAPCNSRLHQQTALYPFNHKNAGTCGVDAFAGNGENKCTVWGDPHFVPFDQKCYSFQGTGAYYYYKSDSLKIQAFQYPCHHNSWVTCIGSVSVDYLGSVLSLSRLTTDEDASSEYLAVPKITKVSPTLGALSYEPHDLTQAHMLTIITCDGAKIVLDWNNWNMMKVVITLVHGNNGLCSGKGDYAVPIVDDHFLGNFVSRTPFNTFLGGANMIVSPAVGFNTKDYTTCTAHPLLPLLPILPNGPLPFPAPFPPLIPEGPIIQILNNPLPINPLAPLGPIPGGPILHADPGFIKNSADQIVVPPNVAPIGPNPGGPLTPGPIGDIPGGPIATGPNGENPGGPNALFDPGFVKVSADKTDGISKTAPVVANSPVFNAVVAPADSAATANSKSVPADAISAIASPIPSLLSNTTAPAAPLLPAPVADTLVTTTMVNVPAASA